MITFMIATTGRESLQRTVDSIEARRGDEILVVGGPPDAAKHPYLRHIPCEPKGDWGHSERNYAMQFARRTYIAHIDDDDVYLPGHRELMAEAIRNHPDRPTIFRMQYPDGHHLWTQPVLCFGNVGTPMTLWPNVPEKFGAWGPFHGGDFTFLQTCKWGHEEYVWRPEPIVVLGHA